MQFLNDFNNISNFFLNQINKYVDLLIITNFGVYFSVLKNAVIRLVSTWTQTFLNL